MSSVGLSTVMVHAAPCRTRAAKPRVSAAGFGASFGFSPRVPAGLVHRAVRSDEVQMVDDTKTVQLIAEVMNAVEAESQSIGSGISARIAQARESRYVAWRPLDDIWVIRGLYCMVASCPVASRENPSADLIRFSS